MKNIEFNYREIIETKVILTNHETQVVDEFMKGNPELSFDNAVILLVEDGVIGDPTENAGGNITIENIKVNGSRICACDNYYDIMCCDNDEDDE